MVWRQRAAAIGVGLFLSLAIFGVGEIAARLLWHPPAIGLAQYDPHYGTHDKKGRAHPEQPGRFHSWERDPLTGEPIYDVEYDIDDQLRRITPVSPEGPRGHFALFFVDSFTFGEGVRGDQTLPYYVGEMAPDYRPYNYAFHGGGPSDLLSRLEDGDLRGQVAEPSGVLIYTFIDHHIDRTVGTLRMISTWGRGKPCYEVTSDGSVAFRGPFKKAHPVRDLVYRALGASRLLAWLGLDWPLQIGDAEFDTTARVLARSKQLFEEQFPGSRFVVAIYPGTNARGLALVPYLDRLGVETLDLSGLFDKQKAEATLSPRDGHPSPLAYRRYARALVDRLGLASSGAAPGG